MPTDPSPRVVLLHGWPGLPSDFDAVRARLPEYDVVAAELAGYGGGFHGDLPLAEATAEAYAGRLLDALEAGGFHTDVIIGGYDIGSRIAQAAVRLDPGRFRGAVLTPAYPGIGSRASDPALADRFWYQHFHRDRLAADLIDGEPRAVRTYLEYIWNTWSAGSGWCPPNLEDVVGAYSRRGAFAASLQWYRANRGYANEPKPIRTPTIMMWPRADPLFPIEWADRLGDFFSDAILRPVDETGHFLPLENPTAFAAAVRELGT